MNTDKKAEIIAILLKGGSIAGGRLRDARHNPLMKLTPKQFDNFRHGKFSILRKHKAGYFVINKKLVRSLHGKSLAKKLYKQLQHDKKEALPL